MPADPYRYVLERRPRPLLDAAALPLVIMLNPSTADDERDDPTTRRLNGFAARFGWPGYRIVNLFAWRASDPAALARAVDPVGPDNDRIIEREAAAAPLIVAAWGARRTRLIASRAAAVEKRLRRRHATLYRIGTATKHGAPRHPLMIEGGAALEVHAPPAAGGANRTERKETRR